ncbi:hypothetical protein GCM10027081_63670 [Cupriavidus yeoncheonensis]
MKQCSKNSETTAGMMARGKVTNIADNLARLRAMSEKPQLTSAIHRLAERVELEVRTVLA